ncbi:hypothetical protein J6590_005318 [Homalodisca vitripennis]|nr:hypothetical protein J6590_005318 [Homalodisca vitripennis]
MGRLRGESEWPDYDCKIFDLYSERTRFHPQQGSSVRGLSLYKQRVGTEVIYEEIRKSTKAFTQDQEEGLPRREDPDISKTKGELAGLPGLMSYKTLRVVCLAAPSRRDLLLL